MNKTSRRGVRLASALVTAGLVLCAVPAVAVADDDNGVLSLTDTQAKDLSERLQLDPAANTAQKTDPQNASPDADDTAGAGTATGAPDSGATDPGTTASGADALAAPKVTASGYTEGVTGMAATVPVAGSDGDYFTVHARGNLTRRTADGKQVWTRDNNSLYKEWDLPALSPRYSKEPYPAQITMGFNAVTPFAPTSDNGYDTGDLTGDGVPDVVFTADVGTYPYRPFVHGDSTLHTGTFVTVLDGASGKTLWTKLYAGAYQVALVDKTLVVADTPYYNTSASTSSTSTLTGIRFDYADGKLTTADSWSYDTGQFKGAAWSTLTPLGGGLVAASWNKRKTTATDTTAGHTLVFDVADGSVKWQSTNSLYSRQLHLDASRGRLVALEMADVNDAVEYEIVSYDLKTGDRTTLDKRTNALAIDLEVGDIRGDSKPEYTVSEDTFDESIFVNANTVRALDGSDASVLWQRTVKRDPDNTLDGATAWNLSAVDGEIVASYKDDKGLDYAENRGASRFARLAVLKGDNGAVNWEKRGVVASQAWAQPFRQGKEWRLRTVDTDQNIHVYNLDGGKQQSILPVQSQLWSAVLMDVNGDGTKDIVAGGQSSGVFAYDGAAMLAGKAKLLWQATVPGQVHKIVKADVDGDGTDEFVVAADTATTVVSAQGKVKTQIDGGGQFVWTVTTGDLNGDGKDEIVVPTDKLRAYDGRGKQQWAYTAPADNVAFAEASIAEGQVYAQYGSRDAFDVNSGKPTGALAVKGSNGTAVWVDSAPKPEGAAGLIGAQMRAATFASSKFPYADGHAVAVSWLVRNEKNNLGGVTEIRDGRTGKVLKTTEGAGPWQSGNWFTGPDGVYSVSTGTVKLYGADGQYYKASATGEIHTGGLVTGPNGVSYLAGAGQTGFDLMDPAQAKTGWLYRIAYGNMLGSREFVSGDLDGDGVDEIVSLNFDDTGMDRVAELQDGGYSVPYTAIRQMTVFTLS
ncbi:FG-GAP repeat domain-containing protein [Streptomyces sp. NPDC055059]|uniref:FG-GAP repeat domain-containing protein n=1 Tax=Streptomyces sp. NPDC127172 TaxID=3345382 RepID=UPI003636B376